MCTKHAKDVKLKPISGQLITGQKRQVFPYFITWTCPHCGTKDEYDLTHDYVEYANVHGAVLIPFYCDNCDEESHAKARARLILELVPPKKGA